MADNAHGNGIATEEAILARHRKERKELQAKIQSLKNRVPKGDKKRKKEVQEEVAKLENQFDEEQGKELAQFRSLHNRDRVEIEEIANKLDQSTLVSTEENAKGNKITRAQKRRNKKESKEKEREILIAQQEIENQSGPRLTESRKLKAILRERNLAIYEVPSDGNCLYAAIIHQLLQENIQVGVEDMRSSTADYMLSHPNDFMPFLSNSSGEPMTTTEFENYCHQVATSSEAWGSQTELQALSQVYKCTIEILQADGPIVRVGEEFAGPGVVLTYHRHSYGLGEHYNSVIQRPAGSEDADSP